MHVQYTYTYVQSCVHICMHVHICVCIYVCVCLRMFIVCPDSSSSNLSSNSYLVLITSVAAVSAVVSLVILKTNID